MVSTARADVMIAGHLAVIEDLSAIGTLDPKTLRSALVIGHRLLRPSMTATRLIRGYGAGRSDFRKSPEF
jgi:hypothetical protein